MDTFSKNDSLVSIESVGIGASRPPLQQDADLPRLRPEDDIVFNRVYDCIVYLMICLKHDRIAVSNIERNKVVWLPFILLQQGITWEQAARDGIAILINRKKDTEVSKLPKFRIKPLNFLRIQMPREQYYTRFTFIVTVEKTPDYRCCENTPSISWLARNDILQLENLWGPEIIEFIGCFMMDYDLLINEHNLDDVLNILNNETYGKFLANCKINSEMVLIIYEEYIEHCYPSVFMCLDSFKTFLIRFGYSRNDSRFPWIFNAIRYNRKGYIDFNEFLIGIVCMEPNTENKSSRLKMLFRYYDVENKGDMTPQEFIALVQDLSPEDLSPKQLRVLVNELNQKIRDENGQMTFEMFEKAIQNKLLKNTDKLCRSPKAIIPQLCQKNKSKNERKAKMISQKTSMIQEIKIKDRGICNGCRAQRYQLGLHCVCFDSDGRCVKPLRLFELPLDDTVTPLRYSGEYVFGISRNYIDMVRAAYQKNEGLMTSPDDVTDAYQTIKKLCDFLHFVLICEEKFLKINGPALVIGNIEGNIDSLMSLEKILWKNIPILTTNLIFLGNYSGSESKYNIEVICYLFALKIASPNMVFLLRGHNETIEHSQYLFNECIQKYGLDTGKKIWEEFNKVFTRMPFVIVVDESIICVHSGIPKTAIHLAKFASIPNVVSNIVKESPLALDIISNIPIDTEQSLIDINEGKVNRKSEFNFRIFYDFMHLNNLSFMIRGHETPFDGYKLYFEGRCITVTSGQNKYSTVALIDSGSQQIQLLKVMMISSKNKYKIISKY